MISSPPVRSSPAQASLCAGAHNSSRGKNNLTFSKIVGQPLLENSDEFDLCIGARIDEIYLTEQELLCDSEVCATGLMAARHILDGVDVTLAITRAKVSAWKLEAEAEESLMVRFKARECDGVPIKQLKRDLRRRRERASLKLFGWFDRVMQAPCQFEEAKQMEDAMSTVLTHIEEEYAKVSKTKFELSEIFYDLQLCLHELLHARSDILMPRLKHINRRIKQKDIGLFVGQASRVVAGVTAIPMFFFPPLLPVGVACAGTALGLQAGISTTKAVHSHFQEEHLAEAFRDDAILCERVLAAAGKLVDHLDTLEPHGFRDLRGESFPCGQSSFVRGILDFVPVVSIVKTSVDMATSFTKDSADRSSIEQIMKQVEIETNNIQSLLSMVTKNCDFSKVHLATSGLSRQVTPVSYFNRTFCV